MLDFPVLSQDLYQDLEGSGLMPVVVSNCLFYSVKINNYYHGVLFFELKVVN